MGFQRARSEEQKLARKKAILNAADKLLNSYAYNDVTMQMLADEVGFSRANLVHYAETKEDIFLGLYVRDMQGLCDSLLASTENKGPMEIEAFAGLFVAACREYKNFVRVGSLLYSILEVNISADRLATHKKQMLTCLSVMAARMVELFPFLREQTAHEALHMLLNQMVGMYPATHPSETQKEAMCRAGFAHESVNFEDALWGFTLVLLHGYKATAQHAAPNE